jgi:hypothetical protein
LATQTKLESLQSKMNKMTSKFSSELNASKSAFTDRDSSLEVERESHLITQASLYSLQSKMTELKSKFDSVGDQRKEIEVCCEIIINKKGFSESS